MEVRNENKKLKTVSNNILDVVRLLLQKMLWDNCLQKCIIKELSAWKNEELFAEIELLVEQ